MKTIHIKIKCCMCGREEIIVGSYEDNVVEVNIDKLCPCGSWMKKV
jgi:hypothetical protein